jgi:hypothetical protein
MSTTLRSSWPRAFRWLGGISLAMALLLAALPWLLLQSAPWPDLQPGVHLGQGTIRLQHLIDRQRFKQLLQGEPVALDLPMQDLAAALNDMTWRTLGGAALIKAQAGGSAQGWLSVPLERTPWPRLALLGNWLNVRGQISQTPHGPPTLDHVQIGSLPLPPTLVLWITEQVAAHYAPREFVHIGLGTVKQVAISPERLAVALHWDTELKARTLNALIPSEERPRIQVYQHTLSQILAPRPDTPVWQRTAAVPLIDVLRPMFQLAQQRSTGAMLTSTSGQEGANIAVRENRAALLALTLYATQRRLAQLTLTASAPAIAPAPETRILLLHGREDFAMHFLLSSLMASGMGGRLTDIIGTYKELSDETSGSGFSFNDLAADRAGVRFGQRALHDPLALQQRIQEGHTDDFFMPNAADLPEYLTPAQFNARFGAVGSPQYNGLMADIEQRINRLGVLAGG